MKQEEPTQEQIKEFWEWCEWKQLPPQSKSFHYEWGKKVMDWSSPIPDENWKTYSSLPNINLNNLFKYAVPKLIEKLAWGRYVDLMKKWLDDILFESKDPALTLFWTIWEVIKKDGS